MSTEAHEKGAPPAKPEEPRSKRKEKAAPAQPEDARAQRMAALVRRLAERAQIQKELEKLERDLEPGAEKAPARGPGRVQALIARMFTSRRPAARAHGR